MRPSPPTPTLNMLSRTCRGKQSGRLKVDKIQLQCIAIKLCKILMLTNPISVLRDCCCTPPVPTMRSTPTASTLVAGGWLGLRTPGESKSDLEFLQLNGGPLRPWPAIYTNILLT